MTYRSLENTIKFGSIKEEKDYEGQMARAQLEIIAQRATALVGMMKDDTQLEAWVQSKITMAEDYVTTVHDYMTTRKGN
jgi:serine protease inhibitor